jgi:cell division protein FtsB
MGLKSKIAELKERSRVARILLNKYFIVTLAFLLIVLFIDNNNAIKWIGNKYKIHQQERLIKQYHRDIQSTDAKIKELTSDRDSLERYAREHYYFQKEGEEVFIVE